MENQVNSVKLSAIKDSDLTICVIILCYNYREYVKVALNSVFSQYEPFDEVIVVDDGSTDGSSEILLEDKRNFKYIKQKNKGVMSASIRGLEASKCDFVYFLDADDYVSPDLVKEIKPSLSNENLVKLQFQLIGVDTHGNKTGSIFPSLSSYYDSSSAIKDNVIMGFYNSPPTSGNVYRRRFLDSLDLKVVDLREPIDGAVNMLAPYFGSLVSIPKALGYYRVHNSNISQVGVPTPERLRADILRLEKRWKTAKQLAPLVEEPKNINDSLFVLERIIMADALEEKSVNFRNLYNLLSSSWRSGLHIRVKLFYTFWVILLLFPSKSVRKKMVFARKSATNRNVVLRFIINFISSIRYK